MFRFSLRTLLAIALLVSIGIIIFIRLTASPPYSGLASDIGDGYESNAYSEDLEGGDLGHLRIVIDEAMTTRQPKWDTLSPNPPVSARQALSIADHFRKHRFRDHSFYDWSLDSIRLTPLNLKENKWCWIVRFEAVPKPGRGGSGRWPDFPVYVMMDGTVIEPEDPEGFLNPKDAK